MRVESTGDVSVAAGRASRVRRDDPGKRMALDIRRQIDSGALKAHDRLRGEKALAAEYGVGLRAVRTAVSDLKESGYLYSKPRSGVFVAEALGRRPADAVMAEGLHAFEIVQGAACRLVFLVLGWNTANKAMWERICLNASRAHPSLTVEPRFPRNMQDYDLWIRRCDLFITSTMNRELYRGERITESLPRSDLDDLPLAEPYIEAVASGDMAIGLPLSGSLLVGGIHPALVSPSVRDDLMSAESWDDILPTLARLSDQQPRAPGINFHPFRTLNLLHHLTHMAGQLVRPGAPPVVVMNDDIRRALAGLEAYRGKAYPSQDGSHASTHTGACRVYLDWTWMFPRRSALSGMTPWLFPLGHGGVYLEGLNIGVISRATPYPDECRTFLRYLLSDSVQTELARIPGEHPVSANIAHPFAGYEPAWQQVLAATKERSRVCYEHVPGYIEFLSTVFFGLAEQFFHGRIGYRDFMARLEERGHRFFARPCPPVAVAPGTDAHGRAASAETAAC